VSAKDAAVYMVSWLAYSAFLAVAALAVCLVGYLVLAAVL